VRVAVAERGGKKRIAADLKLFTKTIGRYWLELNGPEEPPRSEPEAGTVVTAKVEGKRPDLPPFSSSQDEVRRRHWVVPSVSSQSAAN
jgi:hypothetical protein